MILLAIRTLHVILRYILHLYDMRQEGITNNNATLTSNSTSSTTLNDNLRTSSSSSSNTTNNTTSNPTIVLEEKRGYIIYYIELTFDLSSLIIDFVHHVHMLLWSNIFLSMASLVICMQLRYLFHEIQRRYKKHKNYLLVRNHLEQNYPMASGEELAKNLDDNCAICWEKMDTARKLPCTHLFHNQCLQSWLEQDTSCPTCRLTLSIQNPNNVENSNETNDILQVDNVQNVHRQLNHFFHFDGKLLIN